MKQRKIVINLYNYPMDKPGDLVYGMFKEIGVNILYMQGRFTLFYFFIEDGEDEESIITQINKSFSELSTLIENELEFDVTVELAEIKDDYVTQQNKNFNEPINPIPGVTIIPDGYVEAASGCNCGISITLNANNGFGDGRHPTTQGLLWGLKKYTADNSSILDIGSGAGLLAIFAQKCGASKLSCCDSNEDAKDCVKTNLRLNDIDSSIVDFYDSVDDINGTFDSIVVNFPYALIEQELKNIVKFMHPETKLLVSGFHSVKVKDMVHNIKGQGLQIIDSIHMGEWTMFVCTL